MLKKTQVKPKDQEDLFSTLFINNYSADLYMRKLSSINIENLKIIIKYFTSLRKSGKLGEKEFLYLIRLVSANFVENEVECRVQRVLNKNFSLIFQGL